MNRNHRDSPQCHLYPFTATTVPVVSTTATGLRLFRAWHPGRMRSLARIRPVGEITRGTTHPNRLRRVDRWLLSTQAGAWQSLTEPLFIDLGYGASPVTSVEWLARIQRLRPGAQVVGIEISPERVAAGQALTRPGLTFRQGGFEIPLPSDQKPQVIRAFNVLRQYDEAQVSAAWALIRTRLAPGGLLIDGTCDELGRRASWIAVSRALGPQTLTLSARLAGLSQPSDLAERLPKALIHRNVPGEPVHRFLQDLDLAWRHEAGRAAFSVRQRFAAAVGRIRAAGWPIHYGPDRWRLGEVTVSWTAVAPLPTK